MKSNLFALKMSNQPELVKDIAKVAFQDNETLLPEQFAQMVIGDENDLMPWQLGFNPGVLASQQLLWKEGAPAGTLLH